MIHGGDIYSHNSGGQIVDFSSNINPLGPPAGLKEEMDKAFSELTAYPDIQCRELKSNVAAYLKCSSSEVIVGSGALEIISNVCLMSKRVVVFTPCFSEYIRRPAVYGVEVKKFPLDSSFKINIGCLEEGLKKGDLLILGNPNNPTGLRIPKEELRQIYGVVKQKDAFLLLDEAFFEFCPDDYNSVELFKGMDNVCVIRAATKFFAIPGIRLGYGVASSAFAEKYAETESPWSVNSYANAAGRCIFTDMDYIVKTKQHINREREYLLKELSKIGWIKAYKSHANFILIKLLKYDENAVFDRFMKEGIMIRMASNFEGLDSSYIRVAVKDHESNSRLIKHFEEFDE
jgi:threonine-phosphate decarboxylase